MSFVLPYALLLLLPLAGLAWMARAGRRSWAGRLPGAWHQVVSPDLRPLIALRSRLGAAGTPVLCFGIGALLIGALARPGLDADDPEDFATLAGRVIVLDVGSNLARHRHALDALYRADPGVATAVVAVSGDAYRIVPFTTDRAQIDRYVRVLSAEIMPEPGQRPHLGLARAERSLNDAGYLVRQVVVLTGRRAPEQVVEIPGTDSQRYVVALEDDLGWEDWATAQGGSVLARAEIDSVTEELQREARDKARAELPGSRIELSFVLIALSAALWLLLFRRRTA